MTRTVYKYPVEVDDYFELVLPEGSEILTIQMQVLQPMLWALVHPGNEPVTRRFRLAGTGHPITINRGSERLEYINTFQMRGGDLIFHVFEVKQL